MTRPCRKCGLCDRYSSGACRACASKKWASNPEFYKQKNKANYRKHRGVRIADVKKYTRTFPEKVMLVHARIRARRSGVPFDIDAEDIVIPKVCPVLGIVLMKRDVGIKGSCDASPTLDRIFPELGYVKGNVRVISHRANRAKNNLSLEELILMGADAKRLLDG